MTVRIELRRDAGSVGPGHGPWIRRRQVARELGPPDPLALATVIDRRGDVLGWGLYSPDSDIVVRMLGWQAEPPPDDWLGARMQYAIDSRRRLGLEEEGTTGYREINSEGDDLPGLVVDRYEDVRVAQLTTAPMAARREQIVAQLSRDCDAVICTVPEGAAKREGTEPGQWGPQLERLSFAEYGLRFECPAPPGQKTGAYFDQRDNRARVARIARGHGGSLLDLGCHVGGFSVHAAARGVQCVAVDQSRKALSYAADNAAAAGVRVELIATDMFGALDEPALAGPFGTIVLDPPKVATSRRDRGRALGAMRRLLGVTAPRVAPHGHLVLCSCSHHIGPDDLDGLMLLAPGGWTRTATLGPGLDHPVLPGHAEGRYLSVLVYQRRTDR